MTVQKILIIGISEKVHSTKKLIESLENKNKPYSFVKWSSLVFYDKAIFSGNFPLDLSKFSAAFFDIPSYNLYSNKEGFQGKIHFRLNNELHEFLKNIKRINLPTLNRDFLLEYPFYNKFTQAQVFAENKIEAIETFHLSDNTLDKALEAMKLSKMKFPLVIKQGEGGMGEFVWKARNKSELGKVLFDKRNYNLIYQPFIKNDGDFRVLIVGGKSLGIMRRIAKDGEWKNNFALGGNIFPFEDAAMEKFSEEVCRKMKLDYAGIDVFKIGNTYKIIEVNVFACFEGFEKVFPKIDVAEHILNFLAK